jgi:hypothetical protein
VQHIRTRLIVLSLFSCFTASQAQTQLLEDFTTQRKNGMGTDLFAAYLGEDPAQAYSLENGMLKDVVGAAPNGVYVHFFPNTGTGYPFPAGYAQSFVKQGTWNPAANRLRFRVKCSNNVVRRPDGGDILQIGTYIRYHTAADSTWQGDHYYHLLNPNFYANRWTTIEINRVPQHQVGMDPNTNWPEDPDWNSANPVHYFDGLTRFYFDTQGTQWSNTACYFDNFEFDTKIGEAETYVSSLAATYNGSAYEVSWAAPKNSATSYEVRYATSSMKVSGFSTGTAAGTVSSPGSTYTGTFWLSPGMAELPTLYVAIRPVGQTAFTEIRIDSTQTSACDLNLDGSTNSADVQLAVNASIGTAGCSADLDGNGRCDVVDVQRVVNAALGGSCRTGL